MLRPLASVGDRFVATASSNARSLDVRALADTAARHFSLVEAEADPTAAVRLAHAARRAGSRDRLAVPSRGSRSGGHAVKRRSRMRERITVLTFALVVLVGIVGIAFAAGYILGKLLL